ncbi:hypothetical protein V2J09_000652, partial [Rumex salicifolius]
LKYSACLQSISPTSSSTLHSPTPVTTPFNRHLPPSRGRRLPVYPVVFRHLPASPFFQRPASLGVYIELSPGVSIESSPGDLYMHIGWLLYRKNRHAFEFGPSYKRSQVNWK